MSSARGAGLAHGRGLRRTNGSTGAVLRRCSAVAAAIALTSATAGCGQAADAAADAELAAGALAVVVGAHANAPAPRLAGGASAAVDMAVAQGSYLSMVVADGLPYQQSKPAPVTGDGDAGRQGVLDDIAQAAPKSPESDLLGALQLAASSIAEQPGPHQIVVVDSGLSTSGALDFTEPGMLDAEPQYVADWLGDLRQLPDLHGTSVIFQGLGETTEPQAALDAAHRAQLTAIWTTVARQAGAVTVSAEASPAPPAGQSAPPAQPAVPVSTVTPIPDMTCAGDRVTISGGRLDFPRDSDVFVDLHAAVEALRPLADQIIADHLTGVVWGMSAAVGTPEGRDKLSENRAQAVANVLLGLGVVITQLHVEGLGSDFPDYIPDHDANGDLLPAPAALNDHVVMELTGPVSCG